MIRGLIADVRRALPIRWKLAITSAALTCAILTLFATVIGLFAGRQVRAGFDDDLKTAAVDLQELLARVRALLRRRPPRGSASLIVADVRLNPATREVFRGSRALDLTAREFELLEFMMRNERLVVSRDKLLEDVWGYAPFSETNTVDVFVSNLRRKLESGGEPRVLHTVRGAGYVMRAS